MAMNIGEGLRRIGLLAGLIGASLGCWLAYERSVPLLDASRRANEFQALLTRPTLKREVAALANSVDQPRKDRFGGVLVDESAPDWYDRVAAWAGSIEGWPVNKDGINRVFFSTGQVVAVETSDGQRYDNTPAPTTMAYLLLSFYPILGFLLPWGTIRTLSWVVTGFVQNKDLIAD